MFVIAPLFQTARKQFDRKVANRIGCVVEHLAHHFAADAGVGAALYFHERGHGVLVAKQVVERKSSSTTQNEWMAGWAPETGAIFAAF